MEWYACEDVRRWEGTVANAADPGETDRFFGVEGPSPDPLPRRDGSQYRAGRIGCAARVLLIPVVAMIALGWYVAANLQPLGGPAQSPHPIAIASRWVSQDVELTPAGPIATLRVTFTYSGPQYQGLGSYAVTTAPEAVATTPGGGRTLDPAFALVDPAIRMEVVQAQTGPGCAAPCELYLYSEPCSSACISTFDIRLSLVDAAGRDAVAVTLSAGLTSFEASPLPGEYKVDIEPLPSPSSSPAGGGT